MPKQVKVSKDYLQRFQRELDTLRNELFKNLMGSGTSDYGQTPVLDGNLNVLGGGVAAADDLNKRLKAMGGSAQTQIKWLDTYLKQMSDNVKITIDGFTKNEELSLADAKDLANRVKNLTSPTTTAPPPTAPPA